MSIVPTESSGAVFPERVDFRELVFKILKRKWIVLFIAFAVPAIAATYIFPAPWKYTATSMVLIEAAAEKFVSIDNMGDEAARKNKQFVKTGAEIISSRYILDQVAKNLDLINHAVFDPQTRPTPWYRRLIKQIQFRSNDDKPTKKKGHNQIVKLLTNSVNVRPIPRSQLVTISATSIDPELAADIANEVARVYIEVERERRARTAKRASGWLTARLKGLKGQLERAEKTFRAYLASKPFSYFETLPQVMNNPMVQRFQEAEADAVRKIFELKKRYGPDHPRMVAARAERDATRRNLEREVRKIARVVATDVGKRGRTIAGEVPQRQPPRIPAYTSSNGKLFRTGNCTISS